MESNKVRIRLYVSTGFPGSGHEGHEEVDRADWESMSETEREEYLDRAAADYRDKCINCAAWVVGEGDADD